MRRSEPEPTRAAPGDGVRGLVFRGRGPFSRGCFRGRPRSEATTARRRARRSPVRLPGVGREQLPVPTACGTPNRRRGVSYPGQGTPIRSPGVTLAVLSDCEATTASPTGYPSQPRGVGLKSRPGKFNQRLAGARSLAPRTLFNMIPGAIRSFRDHRRAFSSGWPEIRPWKPDLGPSSRGADFPSRPRIGLFSALRGAARGIRSPIPPGDPCTVVPRFRRGGPRRAAGRPGPA